jgi:hypothetical protein
MKRDSLATNGCSASEILRSICAATFTATLSAPPYIFLLIQINKSNESTRGVIDQSGIDRMLGANSYAVMRGVFPRGCVRSEGREGRAGHN